MVAEGDETVGRPSQVASGAGDSGVACHAAPEFYLPSPRETASDDFDAKDRQRKNHSQNDFPANIIVFLVQSPTDFVYGKNMVS